MNDPKEFLYKMLISLIRDTAWALKIAKTDILGVLDKIGDKLQTENWE